MSGSAPGRREVAYRVFAAEFDDAEFAYSESDEERAPNYVVTPTGARVNRLFAVGVLTEVADVNPEMVRGRVVDPTGAVVSYAGQYQPDALAFFERADPPTFVALTGKARTFEPDDGDVVYSSVRPESVNAVEADVRDRWVVTAAERTRDRIGVMAAAVEAELAGDELRAALEEAGVDERLADGVALAVEYYDTTPAYLGALRATALDAVRVVAGEHDEAGDLEVRPADAGGPETPSAADLATLDLSGLPSTPVETADARTATAEEGTTTDDPDAIDVSASTKAAEPRAEEPADTGSSNADAATDIEEVAPTTDTDAAAPQSDADETTDAAAPQPDADGERSVGHREATGAEEPGEFEPGEFDLDEATRETVEEEYGTEFSTADEVEPADVESEEPDAAPDEGPGEPAAEDAEESGAVGAHEDTAGTDAVESGTAEAAGDAADARSATGDVDLEDAVMDAMETVGDESGADREALVAAVADGEGVDPEEVESAIEDALMSGRCYEPSEGTLKAI